MFSLIRKYRDVLFITIGTLLIILSFCLLLYDKVELIRTNVFDEIELLKYQELNEVDGSDKSNTEKSDIIDSVILDELDESEEVKKEEEKAVVEKKTIKKEYIGYLEIKKINLKNGLVSKNSYYNHVNRNIQILDASDYPNKDKGNVILAAHSGTSSLSQFRNLYQLSLGDEAKIYYQNYIYTYKIVNIYNVPKNGTIAIVRDYEKSCLTLITCTKNSKTEQTVYILELTSKKKDGDSK